ncbi:hypothetical protein QBC35DRAFT_498413 [Podospora australis]|uniref:Uncharacterized protein n=1 Tax=Podospora australis TaxID=1536484 RepID=A0AAN7AHN9_9PEZI|nr:hypothetical protein QBC35DRAFT_498413 [Podospora australis]
MHSDGHIEEEENERQATNMMKRQAMRMRRGRRFSCFLIFLLHFWKAPEGMGDFIKAFMGKRPAMPLGWDLLLLCFLTSSSAPGLYTLGRTRLQVVDSAFLSFFGGNLSSACPPRQRNG